MAKTQTAQPTKTQLAAAAKAALDNGAKVTKVEKPTQAQAPSLTAAQVATLRALADGTENPLPAAQAEKARTALALAGLIADGKVTTLGQAALDVANGVTAEGGTPAAVEAPKPTLAEKVAAKTQGKGKAAKAQRPPKVAAPTTVTTAALVTYLREYAARNAGTGKGWGTLPTWDDAAIVTAIGEKCPSARQARRTMRALLKDGATPATVAAKAKAAQAEAAAEEQAPAEASEPASAE